MCFSAQDVKQKKKVSFVMPSVDTASSSDDDLFTQLPPDLSSDRVPFGYCHQQGVALPWLYMLSAIDARYLFPVQLTRELLMVVWLVIRLMLVCSLGQVTVM